MEIPAWLVGYHIELIYCVDPDGTAYWFVHIREWEGCMSEGDTTAEAIESIIDAATGWREIMLENGDLVPPPFEL